jgi:Holliday junction resolvase RusA-like endonuclease
MEFILNIEPKGQQHPRFGYLHDKPVCFKSTSQKKYEKRLLQELKPFIPLQPMKGALSIDITAFMPIPKAWNKTKHRQAILGKISPILKTANASNILKNIEDVMNGRFFINDNQLINISLEKVYGDPPRIIIRLFKADSI